MKRRLVLLLLLVVGGAIVNVAVAWACTLRDVNRIEVRVGPTPPEASNAPMKHPDLDWEAVGFRLHREGETDFQATVIRYPGREEIGVETAPLSWIIWSYEVGLPLRSLSFREIVRDIKGVGFSSQWSPRADHRIIEAIWWGFAINTVFYAVMLWVVCGGPFALRRGLRIKRGLCPKCAYDLRGTQTGICPECGAAR